MKERFLLPGRSFSLITAALAIGLPLLSLAAPVHATPATTFAELYFRRFNDEPFTDPGIHMMEYGTNLTSLSHTSPRGSIARFTADATAGTLRGFADAVNGNIAAGIPGDEVWARGHVQDYFTLHGPTPGAPMSITVSFSLDGTLSGSSSFPGTLEAFENAYVATQFTSGANNDLFAQWARTELGMGGCWESGCPGFFIPVHRETSFALDIIEGAPFEIYYALDARGGWAYGGSGGTSDFGATGAISFALPEGTSITSEGGFSQTNPIPGATPVPAPSTLLLLGGGLAGGALLRKRSGSARR